MMNVKKHVCDVVMCKVLIQLQKYEIPTGSQCLGHGDVLVSIGCTNHICVVKIKSVENDIA